MAKKGLENLLSNADKESKKGSPEARAARDSRNKYQHYHSTSLATIYSELLKQISGITTSSIKSVVLNKQVLKIIREESETYFNDTLLRFQQAAGLNSVAGGPTATPKVSAVRVTTKYYEFLLESTNNRNNFALIDKYRANALKALNDNLTVRLKPYISDISDRLTGATLQIGHEEGYSIAEKRAEKYLVNLKSQIRTFKEKYLPPGVKYEDTPMYTLEVEITNPERSISELSQTIILSADFTKYFKTIRTGEQGRGANYLQSITERKIINSFRGTLKRVLENEDWANFESSTSPIGRLSNNILKAGKKAGGKVSRNNLTNKLPTKGPVKKDIKAGKIYRSGDSTSFRGSKMEVESSASSREQLGQPRNWLQLLPIINSRLTETVAKNMNSPRLNFRTGRFAQSARVVNVEQTRQGLPSFVFDYERDPYDVFDRTLGRSPWNTPQRDPRALVDQSIREIVREMAIGRFFTRRA
jgi:hypothetical protein